jgi:hypothetical protein
MLSRREVLKAIGILAFGQLARDAVALGVRAAVRLPLEQFAESRESMAGLRRAVREMRRRKPSDRLSWFFQSAIHGVSNSMLADAEAQDPTIGRVFQKRYWNQCPHFGDSSANFLPWHRAYTYYFERIVRLHSELDDFALPYWNYNDTTKPQNRKFPREFGVQHLDGDPANNDPANINPLFVAERNFYFAGYEHPLTTALPLLALTFAAVDASRALSAPTFFGDTEADGIGGAVLDEDPGTRGLLEGSPHDQIHRSVGGVIGANTGDPSVGFMANPPTAAFDPVFSVHHTNIDRLWAKWACMPGKSWGRLPEAYWFDERAWFFIDENDDTVNRPRKDFFDYRALGIRFDDDDPACTPLVLPANLSVSAAPKVKVIEIVSRVDRKFAIVSQSSTIVALPTSTAESLTKLKPRIVESVKNGQPKLRTLIRLNDVKLGLVDGFGFDVFVTHDADLALNRSMPEFAGSLSLFPRISSADEHRSPAFQRGHVESFDISRVLMKLRPANIGTLKIVIQPFALFEIPSRQTVLFDREMVTVESIELMTIVLE